MLRHPQYKVATHHQHPDGRIFSWLSFIAAIGNSIVFTILPLILFEKLQNESLVGYYYSIIAVVVLGASIYSTLIFQKFSKVLIAKVALVITIACLFALSFAQTLWQIGGLDIPRIICIITFGVALSIFIDDFTERKNLAKAEGRYYMFYNMGLVIGPIIGGYSAKYFGNQSVFLFAGFFYILVLAVFLYQHIYQKNPHIVHGKHKEGIPELFTNIKQFFVNKEFRKVFLVALGLNYWWCVSVVYIPLEIKNLGYGENIVGWIVAASALPLVLMERFTGKFGDKRGVRTPVILGFSILVLFLLGFPFLYSIPVVALLAFCLVNIGPSFIEPLQETYFFKVAKNNEREKFFGIYNSAQPLSSILSPLIGGLLYAAAGSTGLWIGTGLFLSMFILNGLRIKK